MQGDRRTTEERKVWQRIWNNKKDHYEFDAEKRNWITEPKMAYWYKTLNKRRGDVWDMYRSSTGLKTDPGGAHAGRGGRDGILKKRYLFLAAISEWKTTRQKELATYRQRVYGRLIKDGSSKDVWSRGRFVNGRLVKHRSNEEINVRHCETYYIAPLPNIFGSTNFM